MKNGEGGECTLGLAQPGGEGDGGVLVTGVELGKAEEGRRVKEGQRAHHHAILVRATRARRT